MAHLSFILKSVTHKFKISGHHSNYGYVFLFWETTLFANTTLLEKLTTAKYVVWTHEPNYATCGIQGNGAKHQLTSTEKHAENQ
jgi:hypothetical protein